MVVQGRQFTFTGLPPMNLLQQFCPSLPARTGKFKPLPGTLAQCLSQHGYTRWIAATVRLVHRRTA